MLQHRAMLLRRGEYRLETDDSMFSDLRKELTNMLTSDSMRIAVLGAGGGLGRNVVDAARAAKHDVVALVRDPKRAELPDDVTTVVGDATHVDDVVRAMAGSGDVAIWLMNGAQVTQAAGVGNASPNVLTAVTKPGAPCAMTQHVRALPPHTPATSNRRSEERRV